MSRGVTGALVQRDAGLDVAEKSCRWTGNNETGHRRVVVTSDDRRGRQTSGKFSLVQ